MKSSSERAGLAVQEEVVATPVQLRAYASWIKWLFAIICVVSGTFCSIVFKWQNKVEVHVCENCEKTNFNGAIYQTQLMFFGEAFSLLIYYIDVAIAKRSHKAPLFDFATSASYYNRKIGHFWYWPICSVLDFAATLMMMISLQMTYAATVQMLRNFMVVIAAACQPIILKKAIRNHEIIGVIIITGAMVLTAVPAVLEPDPTVDSSPARITVGVVLTIVGTSIQAIQLILEEFFIRRGRSSPLRCVGWEGIGGIVTSFIAWPICQAAGLENINESWYASIHSGYLTALALTYIPSATIFNVSGLATTLLGSGLLRSVCFAVRSPAVWIISLIIKWQAYEHWSLASTLVFVFGFSIYINFSGFPHGHPVDRWLSKPKHCKCTNPELDEPYDEVDDPGTRKHSRDIEENVTPQPV